MQLFARRTHACSFSRARISPCHGTGGELPEALPDAQARSIHSVIFLDIDGVLNVGVYDTGDAPLLMNEANVGIMKEAQSYDRWQMSEASQLMIEKLASVVQKKGDQRGEENQDQGFPRVAFLGFG